MFGWVLNFQDVNRPPADHMAVDVVRVDLHCRGSAVVGSVEGRKAAAGLIEEVSDDGSLDRIV